MVSLSNANPPTDSNLLAELIEKYHYTLDYCNTVILPAPNPEDPTMGGNAGTIRAFLEDKCGGTFRVKGKYKVILVGEGPARGSKGNQETYARSTLRKGLESGPILWEFASTLQRPRREATVTFSVDVKLPASARVPIVTHFPILGFMNSNGGPASFGAITATVEVTAVEAMDAKK